MSRTCTLCGESYFDEELDNQDPFDVLKKACPRCDEKDIESFWQADGDLSFSGLSDKRVFIAGCRSARERVRQRMVDLESRFDEAQQSEQEAQSQPSPGASPIGADSPSHACSELVGSGNDRSPGVPGQQPSSSFLAHGADLREG
jgi:hypothetical protein